MNNNITPSAMRTNIRYILLAMLLALVPTMLMAGREVNSAQMSGEICIDNVSTAKELHISYMYGEVELVFWNKNEIMLKYVETLKAPTKKHAEDALQRRNVVQRNTGEKYFLEIQKTSYGDRNLSYDSKWTIYVPVRQKSVSVWNEYGNVSVGTGYDKQIRINVKHGDVSVPKTKAMCMVIVDHGNFSMGNVEYLNLNTKYANGTIGFANVLNLSCDHAEAIMIDEVQDLNVNNSQHSKMRIGRLNNAKVSASYCEIFAIDVLGTALMKYVRYSGISMTNLRGRCDFSDIAYSKINVTVGKSNREPRVLVPDARFSDVTVSIPKTLQVSCLLRNKYGKIEFDVPASVKQHVVESTKDYSQTTMHTLLNTTSFAPSSVIDIQNSNGNITIKGY